jgi:hypothetical protein
MANPFIANSLMINFLSRTIAKAEAIPFVIAMWLLSRVVLVVALQCVVPLLFTSPLRPEWDWNNRPHDFMPGYIPTPGWELFSHWDGKWYRTISTDGYEFTTDGYQHAIAFFPLFPLLVRGVMITGLPFEAAGVLVSSLSLLAAAIMLYFWVEESQGSDVAKWVTAVLLWCPSSLFGTVTYSEGLFLLVTSQALWAFDNQRYGWAGFWGALASATRVPGILLLPAFLFLSWRERRPTAAYLAGLATSVGLLLFCLYTTIQFGDPLALLHTRSGWNQVAWLTTIQQAFTLDQPSILVTAALIASLYVLWRLRSTLPAVATVYAVCVLLLLISAGSASFYRYLYGIPTTSFAVGILLAARPYIGYAVLGFFAVSLFAEAIHFGSWDWVRWD